MSLQITFEELLSYDRNEFLCKRFSKWVFLAGFLLLNLFLLTLRVREMKTASFKNLMGTSIHCYIKHYPKTLWLKEVTILFALLIILSGEVVLLMCLRATYEVIHRF